VKTFYCENLFRISLELGELSVLTGNKEIASNLIAEESKETIRAAFDRTLEYCKEIGLVLSARYIERMKSVIDEDDTDFDLAFRMVVNLRGRIDDELSLAHFMQIPSTKATFFQDQALFGQDVSNNFPSTILDIEEAGKCLALSRSTACVFHLMRVVEVGVKAFAQALGVLGAVRTAQPSWGEVLRLTNAEIQAKNKSGDPSWTPEKRGFFENVQADLMTVKNAWRNTTMHVENTYDDERAEDVFNAVKGFMRHLAKHIDESGQFTP